MEFTIYISSVINNHPCLHVIPDPGIGKHCHRVLQRLYDEGYFKSIEEADLDIELPDTLFGCLSQASTSGFLALSDDCKVYHYDNTYDVYYTIDQLEHATIEIDKSQDVENGDYYNFGDAEELPF